MPMQSIPASSLEVIQTAFLFGIFVELLDDPASMGEQNQALQRGLLWQHAEPILDLLFFLLRWLNRRRLRVISHGFWHWAFGQQPAFWSRVDATVAGAVQRVASGPVDAQSYGLNLHAAFGSLTPLNGLPGRGGQSLDQLFDRVQRSRTGLARLTATAVDGRLSGGRLNLVGQTTAKSALHGTHVGHLPLVESLQKVGIASIACIDHHRLDRHAPQTCPIQQPQSDLRLGLLTDLLWDPRLLAALGILGPCLLYTSPSPR